MQIKKGFLHALKGYNVSLSISSWIIRRDFKDDDWNLNAGPASLTVDKH